LFQLTQELNDHLEKTGQSVASLDAIKKVEQIEKACPQREVKDEAIVLNVRCGAALGCPVWAHFCPQFAQENDLGSRNPVPDVSFEVAHFRQSPES
jgi:hypothetical protein